MLLLVERAWVDSMSFAKEGKLVVGHPTFPAFTEGVGKQLDDIGFDRDHGLTHAKELVDKGEQNREENTNGPGADRGAGSRRDVLVVDHGADFGVGAVVGDERGLNLHLLD